MQRAVDFLDRVEKGITIIKPAIHDKDFDRFDVLTGATKNVARLVVAIKTDQAEKRDPTAKDSNTQQVLAEIGREQITDPGRLHDLAATGVIGNAEARRFAFLSFSVGSVVDGVEIMVNKGPGNIEGVEKTLDGIASGAAGIRAMLATFRETKKLDVALDVGQAVAAATELAVQNERQTTLPLFEQITGKFTGVGQKSIAIWEDAQRSRIAHGQPPQNIAQFYHGDASILGGIEPGELSAANARLGLPNPSELRSRVDLKPPPNPAGEHPLGGVQLDQPLTGAALRGVKIDAANGNIILLGERDFLARGLKLRDFAMALWLVFGPQAQDPAFSLDPDDTRNPQGPWLRARYVPDMLQGRSFGADLFAADLLLKELSFHVMLKPDGKLEEWQSAVPGFHSYAELAMADVSDDSRQQQWARFWIVVDQITSRQAGDTWLFEARMAVKARRQEPDPKSPTGLRDIDTDPASLEARWARIATDHYDELAAESPAFARVREMAVAIGIAKSLKAAGARVDLARVADLLNADHTGTVAKINAFSVGWQRRSETPYRDGDRQGVRTETRELHLFGGVDLGVKPRAAPDDDGKARGMSDAAGTAFRMAGQTGIVRFEYGGSRLVAVAIPLLVKQGSAAPN